MGGSIGHEGDKNPFTDYFTLEYLGETFTIRKPKTPSYLIEDETAKEIKLEIDLENKAKSLAIQAQIDGLTSQQIYDAFGRAIKSLRTPPNQR